MDILELANHFLSKIRHLSGLLKVAVLFLAKFCFDSGIDAEFVDFFF